MSGSFSRPGGGGGGKQQGAPRYDQVSQDGYNASQNYSRAPQNYQQDPRRGAAGLPSDPRMTSTQRSSVASSGSSMTWSLMPAKSPTTQYTYGNMSVKVASQESYQLIAEQSGGIAC